MSEGLNRVLLLGNLGADPELRFTQGGQACLNIRIATTESYLDKEKVRREWTDWHNVVVWGKRGESLSKILKKGDRVFVEGSIRTSSYDDRDGNKRYRTDVYASNVILNGSGNSNREGQTQHRESHGNDYGAGSRQGYGAPRPQQRSAPQQPPANNAPPPDDFGYDSGDDAPF